MIIKLTIPSYPPTRNDRNRVRFLFKNSSSALDEATKDAVKQMRIFWPLENRAILSSEAKDFHLFFSKGRNWIFSVVQFDQKQGNFRSGFSSFQEQSRGFKPIYKATSNFGPVTILPKHHLTKRLVTIFVNFKPKTLIIILIKKPTTLTFYFVRWRSIRISSNISIIIRLARLFLGIFI